MMMQALWLHFVEDFLLPLARNGLKRKIYDLMIKVGRKFANQIKYIFLVWCFAFVLDFFLFQFRISVVFFIWDCFNSWMVRHLNRVQKSCAVLVQDTSIHKQGLNLGIVMHHTMKNKFMNVKKEFTKIPNAFEE